MAGDQNVTDRLVAFLEANGVDFRVIRHEPVTTSEEAANVRGTPLDQGAKALVFRADGNLLLLVLPANRRIDSRAFKRAFGVKDLRMVSAEELKQLTGMEVGAVPPFGSLLGLPTLVDERLLSLDQISFNAGSRTVSVVMSAADYRRLSDATEGLFASEP